MNRTTGILASMLIGMALTLGGVQDAQAKRMGGGQSFGSKPSYSQSYQHPASPRSTVQPERSAAQQQAASQNQAARQGWANRGGLMGMLGGLALGGLLGSLFFGGAFENLNLMDMLIFAAIAYLAYRLISARARRQNPALSDTYGRISHPETVGRTEYRDNRQSAADSTGFDTDLLFNKNKKNMAANLPADFDQSAFLAGAERAFRHLQAAWDNRDLASIRELTTDKVFAEIQDQMRASSAANKTEVLRLRAELLEIGENGPDLEAAVLFDSQMREDDGPENRVREVWRFIKAKNSKQPKWFLDGIQQLAE